VETLETIREALCGSDGYSNANYYTTALVLLAWPNRVVSFVAQNAHMYYQIVETLETIREALCGSDGYSKDMLRYDDGMTCAPEP